MFTDIEARPPEPTSKILIGNAGAHGLPLRRTIVVGRTALTRVQVRQQVRFLRDTPGGFTNGMYHSGTRNSHHFVSAVCHYLLLPPQVPDGPGSVATLLSFAHRCSSIGKKNKNK